MADQETLALEIAEEILWPWFQEQIQPYALRRDLFGMLKCGEQQWFGLPEAITRYLAARDKAQAERDEKVLNFINEWGGIDGGHHKQWVLDQLVRIVAGDGYEQWVAEHRAGDEGPDTYEWDEGIAP